MKYDQLVIGAQVTIFQDPITEQKPEGIANLRYVAHRTYDAIDDRQGLVDVVVEFKGEPGSQYNRRVKVEKD